MAYTGQPVSPRAMRRLRRGRPGQRNGFGGNGPRRIPIFGPMNGPGAGNMGPGGYQGIDHILEMLGQGVNAQQFGRMAEGRTGGHGWGGIGGMHGALSGLSPYAVNWLSQNALQQRQYQGQSLEGLEGPELMRAQLMNALGQQNAQANPMYDLKEGIDEDFLSQIFGMGFGGKSAYEKGYDAEGGGPGRRLRPFRPGRRRGNRYPGRGGRLIRGGRSGGGGATIGQPGDWW